MLLKRLWPAAAILLLAGCGGIKKSLKNGAGPEDRTQREARQVMRDLAAEYESEHAEPFFELFDAEDFTDWSDFRYDVRQFMLRNRNITLDFVIDAVVSDDEDTSVETHWNRALVTPAGTTKLNNGTCEIILRRVGPSLRVAAIDGDNPFF